jgi:hypothetical protein
MKTCHYSFRIVDRCEAPFGTKFATALCIGDSELPGTRCWHESQREMEVLGWKFYRDNGMLSIIRDLPEERKDVTL